MWSSHSFCYRYPLTNQNWEFNNGVVLNINMIKLSNNHVQHKWLIVCLVMCDHSLLVCGLIYLITFSLAWKKNMSPAGGSPRSADGNGVDSRNSSRDARSPSSGFPHTHTPNQHKSPPQVHTASFLHIYKTIQNFRWNTVYNMHILFRYVRYSLSWA